MIHVTLPKEFETTLFKYLKSTYLPKSNSEGDWNKMDTRFFSRGIVKLNEAFTTSRNDRSQNYFQDPIMRSGYLAYFLPVNAMKAVPFFQKMMPHLPKKKVKLLDLGSGPLTLVFSYLFYLQSINKTHKIPSEIEIHAVEQNEKILKDGIHLMKAYLEACGLAKKLKVKIVPMVANAFRFKTKEKEFDLISMGNFLNEFEDRPEQTQYVLETLHKFSHKNTLLFMLEPASKKISRDMQALRDQMIEQSSFRVVAPCLHQLTCPLNLTAKGDWCHFIQEWKAPSFIQEFDRLINLKKSHLLYSYLILKNNYDVTHGFKEFVAISNVMPEHGRFETIACGPGGRIRFVRSHKNKDEANRDFDKLHRGQYFTAHHFEGDSFMLDKISNIDKNDFIELSTEIQPLRTTVARKL